MVGVKSVLILAVFIVLGFVLSKAKIINNSHSQLLSGILVYIFLPCKIFSTMITNFTVEYIKEKYVILLYGIGLLLFFLIIAKLTSGLFSKDKYEKSVYIYSIVTPNLGYLGYPIVESIFGEIGLLNFIVFSTPTNIFATTAGYCILTKTKFSFLSLIKKPPIIFTFLGAIIGMSGIKIAADGVIMSVVKDASNCLAPISMLLVGMVISEYKLLEFLKEKRIYVMTALRLIIIPFILGGALVLIRAPKDVILSAVSMYSMSFGFNPIVFGKLVGEDCKLGAGLACISTIVGCITIPFVISFFQMICEICNLI